MGRLKPETLERVLKYADRVLSVVDVLEEQRRSRRVLDQLTGCGGSVGANVYEADEAMSRADFVKTLQIVEKELNEVKFWLSLCAMRGWIKPAQLASLLAETQELKSMFGAMIYRTRTKSVP